MDEPNESQANILCKSCGLCCTGHLFTWVRLRAVELAPSEALGLNVIRSDPRQRGFTQPCPLWDGQCTVYTLPDYPRVCRTYQCKLLKEMLDENISLSNALGVVEQAKGMIHELEALLPASPEVNFRQRLVTHLEQVKASARQEHTGSEFRLKAEALLSFYKEIFGVDDLVENPDET